MQPEPGSFFPPAEGVPQAHACPGCGAHPLVAVHDCDAAHWLCPACTECWVVQHGHLVHSNPLGCSGCREQAKATCIDDLRARMPQFGPTGLEL